MKTYAINEIEFMLSGISPYPWKITRTVSGEYWVCAPDNSDHDYRSDYEPIYESSGTIPQLKTDGEFIAAAPEIIRQLLSEVKLLRELVANGN